ncbi:MAG: ATP/GTP-binding protein [Candidatus Thermoplasmatota archaeon]|nr:ATP/GTP-binding protein [Candidatus Thermoplasmatota archaeon]
MTSAENPTYVYFVGTAGSGKSTLVGAFHEWCQMNRLTTTLLNLDPGVEGLPYTPDVDIRDWIKISEVMKDHDLGPNGAQIAAADMLALHYPDVRDVLESYEQDYVLVDTPGQIELFAFRSSSQTLVEGLSPERAIIVFLFDPNIARTPSGFISSLLLSSTVSSRFMMPSLGVFSKCDLVEEDFLQNLERWSQDPFSLYSDAVADSKSMSSILNVELLKALDSLGLSKSVFPVSSLSMIGMEDIYNAIQAIYQGGEDITGD